MKAAFFLAIDIGTSSTRSAIYDARGERLLETTATGPDYRLYALADTQPPKPGLLRVAAGEGTAIELEAGNDL